MTKKTTVADLKRLQVAYMVMNPSKPEPCAGCQEQQSVLYINATLSPDARCLACFVRHIQGVRLDKPAA